MTIIHYAVYGRNVWNLGSTLNYINILQPVNFKEFLHGNFHSIFLQVVQIHILDILKFNIIFSNVKL